MPSTTVAASSVTVSRYGALVDDWPDCSALDVQLVPLDDGDGFV
jgi:hypothetical protein